MLCHGHTSKAFSMSLRSIVASATFLGIVAVAGGAQAALFGSWNFAGATPLTDGTGNFSNVVLSGTAAVNAGALDISGSGTTTTGWATVSGYTGPTIDSMTMGTRETSAVNPMRVDLASEWDQKSEINSGDLRVAIDDSFTGVRI